MIRRFLTLLAIPIALCLTSAAVFTLAPITAEAPIAASHLPDSTDTKAAPKPAAVTLTFVGDIMLGREVERAVLRNGSTWPFAEIQNEWLESDYVVGNFESTIRDTYRYEGEVLAFDVTPEVAAGVKAAGFTHLSLANNHGDDFGPEVTNSTRESLAALGVTPFGDPVESELHIAHITTAATPIALIGFHAFIEQPQTIAAAITLEKQAGNFVIVLPHWGNEYETTPSIAQQEAAALFITAGANLIVGGHPHVVQPIDVIDGVPVAWSLGNFVFDQDWSQATQEGLLLQVIITNADIAIQAVPITSNRQALLMTGNRVQEMLEFIGMPQGIRTINR